MKKISRFAVLLFCLLASVALLLVFYIIRMVNRPDLASPAICLVFIIVVFALVVAIIIIQLVTEKKERLAASEEAPVEETLAEEEAPAEEPKEEPKEEEPKEEEAAPAEEPKEEAAPAKEVRELTPEELAAIKDYERLQRGFLAKLARSEESVKENYNEIKNAFLSYKKVRTRLSFKTETVKSGRIILAKMQVRGKSLVVFFALEPADLEGKKYKVQEAPTSKAYLPVPVKFRVNSPRKLKQAKEMIEIIANKYEIKPNPRYEAVDFRKDLPVVEADDKMEEKGLIKVKR